MKLRRRLLDRSLRAAIIRSAAAVSGSERLGLDQLGETEHQARLDLLVLALRMPTLAKIFRLRVTCFMGSTRVVGVF